MNFKNPSSRVNVAVAAGGLSREPDVPAYTFEEGRQFSQNISWGGAGLTGSPKSYLKILRMLLNGGQSPEGKQVLKKETVDMMFEPRLEGNCLETFVPVVSQGNEPWSHKAKKQFPGVNYGLGGTLCGEGIPSGRSKGSLTWSGFGTFDFDSSTSFFKGFHRARWSTYRTHTNNLSPCDSQHVLGGRQRESQL